MRVRLVANTMWSPVRVLVPLGLTAIVMLGSGCISNVRPDELYYPSAACKPMRGDHWEVNGGSQGLHWDDSVGAWSNHSAEARKMTCPVPYSRDENDLDTIITRVVVENGTTNRFFGIEVCGRDSHAAPACEFEDDFGADPVEIAFTPSVPIRFLWLEISVPGRAGDSESRVIGYRVLR